MYSRCDCKEDALRIFDKIEDYDTVAYSSIISACANWAALIEGRQIHASITGIESETHISVGNALLHLYGKCGSLKDAQVMFEKMHTRDTVTWSVMIAAHAQQGEGRATIELFNKMQHEGIKPNEITCIGILSACNHVGLVDYACQYFHSMSNMYGIVPVVDHYDCLIDLFARAGRLDDTENLIKVMSFPSMLNCNSASISRSVSFVKTPLHVLNKCFMAGCCEASTCLYDFTNTCTEFCQIKKLQYRSY